MAELLRLAGYSTVGLTIPTGLMREKVTSLRNIFKEAGLETALRIDLASASRMELLKLLRRFRNSYDVIAVKCVNPRVATVACRDRRVDIIFFDPRNHNIRFNHPLANLLRGALEINLISALQGEAESNVFSTIQKQTSIAVEHKVKVVLSSGGSNPEMVRSALQISALARALGLSEAQSFAGVSSNPLSIVERNSIRRSPRFIEEGVRIVMPKVV
jgi:RNase P/RNase MRP subunit p30